MTRIVEVRIAELFVGNEEHTIVTNGVGSCIVVLLYDPIMKIGGLAHAILPRKTEARYPTIEFAAHSMDAGKRFVKFADEAVGLLVDDIESLGGKRARMIAKLVGGARMFSLLEADKYGIGYHNTEAARAELARFGIPIETEVTGGTVGRNVRFDLATGIAEVITKV
ncbi:MAG TPA: chemotaxis protein CheD [Candidatus Paceibacterota bacterium]|nr:chemotaxis protein CheD [Candidatus Paceibacterota bacterium]